MEMQPQDQTVVSLSPMIELVDGHSMGVKIRQAGRDEVRLDAVGDRDVLCSADSGRTRGQLVSNGGGDPLVPSHSMRHHSRHVLESTALPRERLARPDGNRRESQRFPLDVTARIWWQGSRDSVLARITNYSVSGLGIICPEAVTLGRKALIAAGRTLEDIVCVQGIPCWQVQTGDGVMIGFELEENEGKRFGARAAGQRLSKPIDQVGPHSGWSRDTRMTHSVNATKLSDDPG